jgi:type IV secretory pathway VirD2 relaxase
VIVKFAYAKAGHRGFRSPVASTAYHLRYMEKGDHGHEQYPLYKQEAGIEVDKQAFAARTRQDPHQWHIVLSPERGAEVDLTSVTRRTMAQLERDTGYATDWVAVNHYDTAHPHAHILLRGRDLEGEDVGLKRDYLTRSLTYRVQDILTQDLGYRQDPKDHAHERRIDQALERDRP